MWTNAVCPTGDTDRRETVLVTLERKTSPARIAYLCDWLSITVAKTVTTPVWLSAWFVIDHLAVRPVERFREIVSSPEGQTPANPAMIRPATELRPLKGATRVGPKGRRFVARTIISGRVCNGISESFYQSSRLPFTYTNKIPDSLGDAPSDSVLFLRSARAHDRSATSWPPETGHSIAAREK